MITLLTRVIREIIFETYNTTNDVNSFNSPYRVSIGHNLSIGIHPLPRPARRADQFQGVCAIASRSPTLSVGRRNTRRPRGRGPGIKAVRWLGSLLLICAFLKNVTSPSVSVSPHWTGDAYRVNT